MPAQTTPIGPRRQPHRLLSLLERVLKVLGWLTHLGLAGRATPTAAERVRVPSQIKYVHQTMLQPRGSGLSRHGPKRPEQRPVATREGTAAFLRKVPVYR